MSEAAEIHTISRLQEKENFELTFKGMENFEITFKGIKT